MIDNTAKTLNWLKFNPVIYVNSDLCLFENYHIQGLYMHVIAFYWQKKGEVSLKALQAKFGDNAEEIQHLLNESYLQLDGDMIHIDWLDIKIAEAIKRSVSGSQNASKRWNGDATAMPPQCDRNATAMLKEKKRNKKKKKRVSTTSHTKLMIVILYLMNMDTIDMKLKSFLTIMTLTTGDIVMDTALQIGKRLPRFGLAE